MSRSFVKEFSGGHRGFRARTPRNRGKHRKEVTEDGLEDWRIGGLEGWSDWSIGVIGVLERWSVGALECWSVGALERWSVLSLTPEF